MMCRQWKRLLSFVLAMVMVVGMIPAMGSSAMAAPGGSSMDPVICDTFAEFKAAMEDPSVIYVTLLPTDEIIPQLGEGSPVPAITVAGEKDLYLAQGVAQFSARSPGGVYDCLLQVNAGSSLSIDGEGDLSFMAVGTEKHNAVIYNNGGDVRIYDGHVTGEHKPTSATYSTAIWQDSGTLTIQDGYFSSMDGTINKVGSKETCAVYLAGGSTHILGGRFWVDEKKDPEAKPYGLYIEEAAEVGT